MTSSYVSKIFYKNGPLIASAMRPFIEEVDSQMNKKTYPCLSGINTIMLLVSWIVSRWRCKSHQRLLIKL